MKKVFLLLAVLFLVSCNDCKENTANDVRKIKVGMSTNEVKYLLGEPRKISIQNGYEEWYFRYEDEIYRNTFEITIVNFKVIDFESY